VHAERGPIRIEDSPHYAYVRIYSSAENKYVKGRTRRFDGLILAYKRGAKFEIAVRWNSSSGVFLVVDGFHRLACVAAIDPGSPVKCIVLL
jgi:hypothetical protein